MGQYVVSTLEKRSRDTLAYEGRIALRILHIQLPKTILGHLLFFTVNDHFQEGETLAKHDLKPTIFSSIGCTNLVTFSINFGYDSFLIS